MSNILTSENVVEYISSIAKRVEELMATETEGRELFIERERIHTLRYNKLLELVSSYDQSVYHGVEFEPHDKDVEAIMEYDNILCYYVN
mgnify:CR=1 FL=1